MYRPGQRPAFSHIPGTSRTVRPVIRFEKVTKSYAGPDKPALNQVTINVDKGEFVFLVGASGSGKSTALRLLLREMRPTTGRVYVAGKEINRIVPLWAPPPSRPGSSSAPARSRRSPCGASSFFRRVVIILM